MEEGKGNRNGSYLVERKTAHGINVTRVLSHEKCIKRCADITRYYRDQRESSQGQRGGDG